MKTPEPLPICPLCYTDNYNSLQSDRVQDFLAHLEYIIEFIYASQPIDQKIIQQYGRSCPACDEQLKKDSLDFAIIAMINYYIVDVLIIIVISDN